MNKYVVILLLGITCLLTACGYKEYLQQQLGTPAPSGSAVSGGGMRDRNHESDPLTGQWGLETSSGDAVGEMEDTAASGAVISGSGIASADYVTASMQTADYWIARTLVPDKVLMSAEEIAAFNEKMMKQLSTNSEAGYYDLSSYGDTISKEELTALIQRTDFSKGTYYMPERQVTEELWQEYDENKNLSALKEKNPLGYGIVCTSADVREIPLSEYITDKKGDTGHDILQNTVLAVNEPVLILHASKDGQWFYVAANEYTGWVEQNNIGLCKDKGAWQKAQEMKRFLVVTGDKVSLEQQVISMGTRLALATEEEYQKAFPEAGRVYDNYIVKIPYRDEKGELQYGINTLPVSRDVQEGYMEYTRANVLRQSFKMLGNTYGWGGSNGDRDCSSMVRDIYLCFGLRLPRNSSAQALIPGEGRRDLSGKKETEKKTAVQSVEPGTVLQMPGHVMIYLGCVEQQYFVISANGEFVPASVTGEIPAGDYTTRRVTVNTLGVRSPSNQQTWLSQITTIVGIP
ncbi:MAG: SH3 domain-containing protein [Lachnospiraceae bacterium]|nr:SH3 domain-containing protein [Lachnospiraceae bacterium]